MALITRISRLFQADLHAVLDRIEEPDLLLRQAVREMEDDLARDEQGMKALNHELGQLISRETDIGHSLEEIEDELDVCFESGKDDLARALIKRKLEALRFQKFLSRKREVQGQHKAMSANAAQRSLAEVNLIFRDESSPARHIFTEKSRKMPASGDSGLGRGYRHSATWITGFHKPNCFL